MKKVKFDKEKFKKLLRIVFAVLAGFAVLTALYFWGERAYNFLQEEDDLAGMPCYKNGDIATIEIKGEIIAYFVYAPVSDKDDFGFADAVSSEEVAACVNDMQNDDNIKAVIVEINSYGGSPVASEEIMNALKGLDKPIAAVVREGAVSGAYLIATAADRIFASELSDIGGIGVTMSYLDYSQQNEADGIIYQQLSSGKFKDAGDPNRPLTDEEKELFMRDTKLVHEMFIRNVATNRNLDIKKVRELADGSSMLGAAAKENGLIDEIGDRNSAENWLSEN